MGGIQFRSNPKLGQTLLGMLTSIGKMLGALVRAFQLAFKPKGAPAPRQQPRPSNATRCIECRRFTRHQAICGRCLGCPDCCGNCDLTPTDQPA